MRTQLRTKSWDMEKPLPQDLLNIREKSRSNAFAWRGQFSPQLIEHLLGAYCPPGSVVLDPFVGSGTVLHEAATYHLPAFGSELNPSACALSKFYEFANISLDKRGTIIQELVDAAAAESLLQSPLDNDQLSHDLPKRLVRLAESLTERALVLYNVLIVTMDIDNNPPNNTLITCKLADLVKLVQQLPYSDQPINAGLCDARSLPLPDNSIDFVVTSPPYINVFNYHQNYRRSMELLGWNVLTVAQSEIGSNRANRQNRFHTVVQYCIDMAHVLQELARVAKPGGRVIMVLGHQSNVLRTPFYNAELVEALAVEGGTFDIVLRQQRIFTNRFGQAIREDVLNLAPCNGRGKDQDALLLGRHVADAALHRAAHDVPDRNRQLLVQTLSTIDNIVGTPVLAEQR